MNNDVTFLKSEIRRLRKELARLTPDLNTFLKRRGFSIYKKEPSDDLFAPSAKYGAAFYNRLKKYSFRLFLRDVIKHQNYFTLEKVTKFATLQVSAEYLEFMRKAGLIEVYRKGYRLARRPIKSFGETLEWFIARVLHNDFQAEALWGVKFKRPGAGGDYDLIAKVDSALLYMEIKSSPPKQIYDRGITLFFDRLEDLSPDISVFYVDTELRMKDKIVPMVEAELLRRYKNPVPVERIEKELFHVRRKVFIVNAKGGISSNLNSVFTCYWHREFLFR